MHPKVLPVEGWEVVRKLEKAKLLGEWVLAGGTGLALQLGHRRSVDLDFFTEEDFDSSAVRQELVGVGRLVLQAQDRSTLHVTLDDLRLSYLRAEAPFLFPTIEYRGLRLADPRDIAVMKVVAVVRRGSRKDFVDLYAYLEAGGDFPSLMELVRRRFKGIEYNQVHLLRSLVFFEDAEEEAMPRMLQAVDWAAIRLRLEDEVKRWAP